MICLGAWLGVTFGWRWSFGGFAILTLVVLALAVFAWRVGNTTTYTCDAAHRAQDVRFSGWWLAMCAGVCVGPADASCVSTALFAGLLRS